MDINAITPNSKNNKWRKIMAFFGPAYLVSVGYMDPGNWATGIAGGSRYGYTLIWVLLMSNLMAIFLQSICARLGVVRRKDLAQCNREAYPKATNFLLYLLAEIAIAATDLAEVLGMAIGLQLLFGLPLFWGVIISFLDTLLLLWLQKLGMRKTELFIIGIIAVIGGCFMVEMFMAQPQPMEVLEGFIPSLPDKTALYISLGIIGATVMPHNLYLHSALVQTRKINRDEQSIRKAIRYNFWDSAIALNIAFLVNAAILILAAAVFFKNGYTGIAGLEDAHQMLDPLLGSRWASILFAVALIAAGQSSTITGTLAGQVVMEGYLKLRISPALRRIITRMLAIVPAVVVLLIYGEREVGPLLILSQVILSMQLAFAIIPLIHFVSDKRKMGIFALKPLAVVVAWGIAVLVILLNVGLAYEEVEQWLSQIDSVWGVILVWMGIFIMVFLLLMTIFYPLTSRGKEISATLHQPLIKLPEVEKKAFKKIALAVDFSPTDQKIFHYGFMIAQPNSYFILIHITESVTPQLMDEKADDYETREDREMLQQYLTMLKDKGFDGVAITGSRRRNDEIVRIVKEQAADLLIMGSHGHRGIQDFIFGETVNQVRHRVKIPVFVAQ